MANSDVGLVRRTRDALQACAVDGATSVVVGVSGGVDSISMLHVLSQLRDDGLIGGLSVAHVNHHLRGAASDADEAVVQAAALGHSVAVTSFSFDTKTDAESQKLGIEECARRERYEAFAQVMAESAAEVVITAHTLNDQVETVLMNLVRGAGVRGLAGIPVERELAGGGRVVRPWLMVSREEIIGYATAARLTFAEDASNQSDDYQRNRVRHLVVPSLVAAFPHRDVLRSIGAATSRFRAIDSLLGDEAARILPMVARDGGLDASALRAEHAELHAEVVELWLAQRGLNHRFSADERLRLERLLSREINVAEFARGLKLELLDGIVRRAHGGAGFQSVQVKLGTAVTLPSGMIAVVPEAGARIRSNDYLYLNRGRLENLWVRPWEAGDELVPFGMGGHRKLVSDLLTDAGVLGSWRKGYPVVEDRKLREIVWIPGVRGAESGRWEDSDVDLIELRWTPSERRSQSLNEDGLPSELNETA